MQRIRNYLTPIVSVLAVAVLGATALAVAPDIIDGIDGITGDQTGPVGDVIEGLEPEETPTPTPTPTEGAVEEGELDDLFVSPVDTQDEIEKVDTPTVQDGANHGQYVSCIARMAKSDPTVQGRQKGKIVSFAAKQDVEMVKGTPCTTEYAAVKAAALAQTGVGTEDGPGSPVNEQKVKSPSAKKEAKQVSNEVTQDVSAPTATDVEETEKGAGQGGPPQGGPSANGKGRRPGK